ncbi:flavin reductase family protein [Marinomonas pollencensis]|uniref:Flavin reductase (DIM6/NTAB) family NADH-FMN oxidoreductase RutF n=1 Tax=Marinomonas pollencensis TaxID=491954 RepID=A0A3E0DN59_9GAMM|nr:flavin reductase family protein [Marinomonas pollencensis]REG84260.1 flavin reductase (DIM6/NTAB) family NADH-FMN oxidoreductase RutF [Marinomonas pollencensis]
MLFQFDQLSGTDRYHLITQTVTPRPIAWIMTRNENQTYNLAPFSFFSALCPDPALLVVSIGNKNAEQQKDTKQNLIREQECVLHIPSAELVEAVNLSAATLAYGESELTRSTLSLTTFTTQLPRIADAKVAMHCRLYDMHPIGSSSFSACYLEILSLHVDDDILRQENGRNLINSAQLNPLSRLGGNDYALIGQTLTIKRPE